jgi:hypothetical protein
MAYAVGMITLLATHHTNERARERIGWHRRTLDRMLECHRRG